MNTSPCTNIEPRLPDYLAGALPDAERAEIHAHLAGCPACREMADTLQLLSGAMAQVPLRETLDEARREQIHEALRTRGTRPAPVCRWAQVLAWLNPARAPTPALRLAMSVITFVALPLCLIALLAPSMTRVKSRADHEAGWATTAAPSSGPESALSVSTRRDAVVLAKEPEATREAPASDSVVNSVVPADDRDAEVTVPLEIAVTKSGERLAFAFTASDGAAAPQLEAGRVDSPAPETAPAKPARPPAPSEPAALSADQALGMQGLFAGHSAGGRLGGEAQVAVSGKDQHGQDDYSYKDSRRRSAISQAGGLERGSLRSELKPATKTASGVDMWDSDGDKRAVVALGGVRRTEDFDRSVLADENGARGPHAAWYSDVPTPVPAAPPVITVRGTAITLEDGRAKHAGEKAAARPARSDGNERLSLETSGERVLSLKGLAGASDDATDEVSDVAMDKKKREEGQFERDYLYDATGREGVKPRGNMTGVGEGEAALELHESESGDGDTLGSLARFTVTNGTAVNGEPLVAVAPVGRAVGGGGAVVDGPRPAAPREPAGFNPYTDAKQDAFSTFAIDVDTASYTLTRQALGEGRMPDPEEVRTEEIVNAFDYDYAPPAAGAFALHSELAPSPFRAPLELLKIGVQGRLIGRDAKRPAVLTLVIDGSGSMDTADRLGRIRRALHLLAGQLKPQDSIAIVQFSEQARLLLDRTSGTNATAVRAAVDALGASGSTDLEAGLRLGYEVAARGFRSGAANRVILLSDGVANLGAASAQAILATVEQYRRQGIYLTVLGFGRGNYDDAMLEQLANKGDGQYAFVDSDAEAKRLLVDQWEQTLHVIARDVKIQVEFNPERVVRWRQVGYENRKLRRQDFRNDAVDAGEVGSGQSVTALYDLELIGDAGQPIATVRVRYQDPDTRAVTELEQRVTVADRHRSFDAAPPRYRVAACAAEFAERLRVSPYAAGTDWETLVATLRPAALELPLDQRVQELLRLAEAARGLAD